jgi:tol-pal system protein YbgF
LAGPLRYANVRHKQWGTDVKTGRVSRYFGAGVLGLALGCQVAAAQDWNRQQDWNRPQSQDWGRPPADVPDDSQQGDNSGALALRIDRLEAALRRATGQIEELQNDNRKLADKLKRFQDDVEFRLSGKTGAAALPAPGPVVTAPEPAPTKLAKRDDAFDPDANPNAPGAPKPIGSTTPSAPLNLSSRAPDEPRPGLKPLPTPSLEAALKPKEDEPPTFVAGAVPFSDSKQQFDSAKAAYKAGQYADAEALFKAYLDANKGVANAADAVFYIGETYMQRSRPREAAEQYLKVSTEYPKSRIAPDAMVRLGLALAKLGNNEQACATFAEVGRRYPTARSEVKRAADREIQAHRCS